MAVARRAPPRSQVIQSIDEFRAALVGPREWIDDEVAKETVRRAEIEQAAQAAYDTKPQRDYTRAITEG